MFSIKVILLSVKMSKGDITEKGQAPALLENCWLNLESVKRSLIRIISGI